MAYTSGGTYNNTNTGQTSQQASSTSEHSSTSEQSTSQQTSSIKLKYNHIDTLSIDNTRSQTINRTFGREGDYMEIHIYNLVDDIFHTDENFTDYAIVGEAPSNTISIDPTLICENLGFTHGKYRLKLNVFKNRIFNSSQYPFIIKAISSDRREIRAVTPKVTNALLDPAVSRFISSIESSAYFREFSLNLGHDVLVPCINVLLNKDPLKHEILLKTLDPLPLNIQNESSFKVVEEISDPMFFDVDLGTQEFIDPTISIREPNFQIDIRQNSSIPSGFKSYDDLLSYNITSSYENLLSKLEDQGTDINIKYDYIRPVSESLDERSYHFESFVHFSSALERIKNFKYKLELIEKYDREINSINSITGDTSGSPVVIQDKNLTYEKKEKIIKGLDGYEQFLYFTSGTFAWPKTNTSEPYNLYPVTSSEAKTWLGSEDSSNTRYGGELLSASLFDRENPHNLNKLIPEHILDNEDNTFYVSFVNMVGQHFDHLWTYIKAITEIHNTDNVRGISKDLVYFQLKSLGIETFDQFENSNLIEYILGQGTRPADTVGELTIGEYVIGGNSTNFFSTPVNQTLVTASNDGSIPKGDITKEIWKRLYHNATYLLKTKGTERGIRALMSCYGFPTTILSIKEYGGSTQVVGPLKNIDTADYYKTFTYQKSSLSMKGSNSSNNDYFIKTKWSSSLTDALSSSAKTIEFRIKPLRIGGLAAENQHLFTLSSSAMPNDLTLILNTHTGSDIYEPEDSTQFGKLELLQNNSVVSSTDNFKIYNGDFWNIFIGTEGTSGSNADVKFGAYQSNFLKNILNYTASWSQTEVNRSRTWGDPYYNNFNNGGAEYVYFCGVPLNTHASYNVIETLSYSGSLQEIKYHFHQSGSFKMLTHSTLKKHALEPFMYSGNHITSSFNEVMLRLPLGSNDQEDSSSFHPNIDVDFLDGNNINSNPGSFNWEEIIEDHYLPTPDTVGRSWTSEKVRIDEGTIDENILSLTSKNETSTLDRQPLDYPDLGIFFSPTSEINEDIIYTLGAFRLDDYIGSPLPSSQTSSKYEDLKDIKNYYFKKVKRRYNYYDYIKVVQQLDHTLFKLIEQFVPYKANTKTGLLIEPHFLERPKFQRSLPVRSDGQTMTTGSHQTIEVQITTPFEGNKIYSMASSSAKDFGQEGIKYLGKTKLLTKNDVKGQHDPGSYVVAHNNFSDLTSSKGYRKDYGTNANIGIYDSHLDPFLKDKNAENQQSCQAPIKPYAASSASAAIKTKPWNYKAHDSSVLLGNMMKGRKSNKYYKYTEYFLQSSSLYGSYTL
tara:strand:- start:1679 stop:5545 length:3867 start_codon:yes stop_codon:yes gene_type:complete